MAGESKKNSYLKGKQGEQLALKYIETKGYSILKVNYRATKGEIDIIAIDHQELVILEVKSQYCDENHLDESMTMQKRNRLEAAAEEFLHRTFETYRAIRFEVLWVSFPEGEVQHFQQEFLDF